MKTFISLFTIFLLQSNLAFGDQFKIDSETFDGRIIVLPNGDVEFSGDVIPLTGNIGIRFTGYPVSYLSNPNEICRELGYSTGYDVFVRKHYVASNDRLGGYIDLPHWVFTSKDELRKVPQKIWKDEVGDWQVLHNYITKITCSSN